MPVIISEKFGKAVSAILDERGLSTRAAMYKTKIDSGTILRMRNDQVPQKGVVIDFAQGLGENINKWLAIAEYEPIPQALVNSIEPTKEYILKSVRAAAQTLSKEDMVEIRKEFDKFLNMDKDKE